MELRKIPFTHLLVEMFSVVFAVLLALAVNEWRTNQNNKDLGLAAFEKVVKEVEGNKSKISGILENHKNTLSEIDTVISKIKRKSSDITFGQILFEAPASTAWEAAKLTSAVNYLDYSNVEKMTAVYSTQKVYSDVADKVFQELVFFVPDEDHEILVKQFSKQKVYLYNLILIEDQLIEEYDKFLNEIKS